MSDGAAGDEARIDEGEADRRFHNPVEEAMRTIMHIARKEGAVAA